MSPAPAGPLLRGHDDEQKDYEDALHNFQSGAYREWPNKAGFEGLIEERGPIEIAVSGTIPSWAIGSLYRTGPGVYTIHDTPKGTYHTDHWFDGLAHTHRFDITLDPHDETKVKVFYSSRRQSELLMELIKKTGTMKYLSFGQKRDPCLGLFAKVMGTWQSAMVPRGEKWIENVSVAIFPNAPGLEAASGNFMGKGAFIPSAQQAGGGHRIPLPKNVWATTDNNLMKQMDPQTLEPIGFATQSTLHPALKGPLSCAHAQRDPVNGDMYNFNQDFGRETVYRIFRVSASTGQTEIIAELRGEGVNAAYIHSFFLTEHFVVLCIPSSHIGWGGVKIPWAGNIADAIDPFHAGRKMRWFVVDRTDAKLGVVERFESDAGFFFHSINAFEEDDGKRIVCDMMEYRTLDVIQKMYCNVILQKDGATERFWGNEKRAKGAMLSLARFSLSLEERGDRFTPVEKVFAIPAPHAGELPTINPLYATRKHRYVYSLPYQGKSTMMDGIVKTDTKTRKALFWDIPKGHSPGEAIFVPRPGASWADEQEEDDGVLLSVVLNGFSKTSYLLCLDARTMKEIGRAEMEFAIGLGFHGAHVAADTLGPARVTGNSSDE
ncbi:carotenoid oxygenase [Apiosordaria backusii]|uniref:Carotenoid oxygenase n=1 Tax=Apiosordaria backusii TaxID=314023 RepID=A0AA39ZRN5_9PEZI|nr:carotenoid oxygenase [Apiosordaria backusii]